MDRTLSGGIKKVQYIDTFQHRIKGYSSRNATNTIAYQPKLTEEEMAARRARIQRENKRREDIQKKREAEEIRQRQLQDEASRQEELEREEAIRQARALEYV